jgi:predicted nucleic acid-binding protein
MSAEAEVVFLDTNILLYAHDRSALRKHTAARELVEACWEKQNGCLSVQVLQEFYVNLTQKIAHPVEPRTARQLVEALAHWKLHTPRGEDILLAIDLQQTYRISFWDAMVLQSAASMGCRTIYSEDLSAGQIYNGVQVVNPFGDN